MNDNAIHQKTAVREFPNKPDVIALSAALNKFSRDLYLALAKSKSGNVFFSPFSISAAMAMAHMGTGGNTEEEVKKIFHFPQDKQSIERAYHDLLSDYKHVDEQYHFSAGNMSYISDEFTVKERFISAVMNAFYSTTKTVDFHNKHAKITLEINEIVENETKSMIKDLIPPGILSPLTRMVLVNFVYFKGTWVHTFTSTIEKPFWIKRDKVINVPMMTIQEGFRVAHLHELDAKLLALEYQGGRMDFVVILPNEKEGLAVLEEKLVDVDLSEMEQKAAMTGVTLTIPKFKLEESMDLVTTLKSLGINDLFSDDTCDLSGMADEKGIFVSDIIHKALLDVNEKGTEAAAATVMVIRTRRLCVFDPTIFLADHPFLFYIRDKASDSILFMGRYTNPKSGI